MIVDAYRAGNPAPEGTIRSVQRWAANGILPFRMTGNKPTVTLSRQYLLLLIIFKQIWPQSTAIEAITFIANESDDARVF
jgi:hypothetical protein